MGYSRVELFENVKSGSKQEYALKQKFAECVECGWTEKHNFQFEEDIICLECYEHGLERMN